MSLSGVTDWDAKDSALRVAEDERKRLLKFLWALIQRHGGRIYLSAAELDAVPEVHSLSAQETLDDGLKIYATIGDEEPT